MPFYRSRGFKRRFSATPRRSWRRRAQGTLEPRMQIAQTFQQEVVVTDVDGNPGFLLQALTPWANSPAGGYDAAWEIKGMLVTCTAWPISHSISESDVPGLYTAASNEQIFCPFAGALFVDGVTPNSDGPTSLGAFSPFATTPPMGAPGVVPSDDDLFPVRVCKQKVGQIQVGVLSGKASREETYAIGINNFRWSFVLRKRLSIASRQGLFLGFYADRPFSLIASLTGLTFGVAYQVKYYYRLKR